MKVTKPEIRTALRYFSITKGCAKGFGGLVLKPIAGSLGLGAYTFKGIHYSIRRRVRDTEKTDRWIRRARIAQGQRDAAIVKGQKRLKDQPPYPSQHHEIDELRDYALRQWTTHEKNKVIEGREKEKRKPLLNMAPQNGGKNNKRIPRAKTQ